MINLTFVFRLFKGRCHGNQVIFGSIRRNWPTPSSFVALAFQNGLDDRKVNGRINSGNKPCISIRNLVSFCAVTPKFTRPERVQQASISYRVSSTVFDRGGTARPGGLHSRFCHIFLL